MCAALLAGWWRGEYSNSIVYVVIDGESVVGLDAVGRGGHLS
jgi:hypothetical protein